jgi:integrase
VLDLARSSQMRPMAPASAALSATTPVTATLILDFAHAHGGRKTPAGRDGLTKQGRDYRDKISLIWREFEAAAGRTMLVGDLFGDLIDPLLRARRHRGRPLSTVSRNTYRAIVRSMSAWLHSSNRWPGCPRALCRDETEDDPDPVWFEPAELEAVRRLLRGRDTFCDRRLLAAMEVALATAARLGDVLSIETDWLDRAAGTVSIVRKGGKRAQLPLTPQAFSAIERYQAARITSHQALFTTDDERGAIEGKSVSRNFTRAVEKAGINRRDLRGEKLTFHALRRTWVRAAVRADRPIDEICAFTGWSLDYAHQVLPRYRRPDLDDLRKTSELVAARLR